MQITFIDESDNGKQDQERVLTLTGQRILVKLGKALIQLWWLQLYWKWQHKPMSLFFGSYKYAKRISELCELFSQSIAYYCYVTVKRLLLHLISLLSSSVTCSRRVLSVLIDVFGDLLGSSVVTSLFSALRLLPRLRSNPRLWLPSPKRTAGWQLHDLDTAFLKFALINPYRNGLRALLKV